MVNVESAPRRARSIQHSTFNIQHSTFLFLLAITLFACTNQQQNKTTTIEFWGLGREGEVVADMVPEFERRNPGIKVDVQQIPWTAAHEKLLTAHVGRSLPDVAQMGNTWIPEFVTIGALEPLDRYPNARADYFGGIWDTNVVDHVLYGIPWYVDTRVLFYRTDMIPVPPKTWSEWTALMARLRAEKGKDFYPILLPTNEWPQPVILALGQGAPLVSDDARALFNEPRFLSGFGFYLDLFRHGYAPVVANSQIANIYQQFGEGEFAMWITGPWNVGELRRRWSAGDQGKWSTAPIPAPDGKPYPGASLAGGASLVLAKTSQKKAAAWKFIQFLSEPAQQVRFYELSGDLPARKSAWNAPLLANDDKIAAFRTQLENTVALPRVPEWEYIATTIFEHGELAARGQFDVHGAAERLDVKVNRILEKRRWVVSRQKRSATP
ncbi:MAG: multiple sugar transport system substrate-binding protein [Acidobacteriota bacterium]|jgi:multiple sugar transport system substrate-binding protein|nr:multiple sugar transport system substrate-binding protein [Acidobacteriota bacterium]